MLSTNNFNTNNLGPTTNTNIINSIATTILRLERILIPLLSAIALPNAVNAESYWLVLETDNPRGVSHEKLEMESMEQCEEQGKIWKSSDGYRY